MRLIGKFALSALLSLLAFPAMALGSPADTRVDPVSYQLAVVDPASREVQVEVAFPAAGGEAILYLPVWTPGYYVKEDFKRDVVSIDARDRRGRELAVSDEGGNRWRVQAPGCDEVLVRYVLRADKRSVSTNELADDYLVLNGSATYVTAVGSEALPQEVALSLPRGWKIATGLAGTGVPGRYAARDYAELVDSPIMAGELEILHFESARTPHSIAYNRGVVEIDKEKIVADLKRMVDATRAFWNEAPWRQYAFLLAFRKAGGGLEHMHSTFVNIDPERFATPRGYAAFVSLLAHEYQHAFNVKRLRPIELGPFDYENPPTLSSLWIPEGLTSYYSNLMLVHSGLIDEDAYLAVLSRQITALQNAPGRLKQSLEESSRGVWSNSLSGVGASAETVSYYVKGEIAGFLLDARIREATNGARGLDDAMRLAYARYSQETGFRPEDFRTVVEEIAGQPMDAWFASVVASATELDYGQALDWYGLQLDVSESGGDQGQAWTLSHSDRATGVQRQRFREWLSPD